MSEVIRFVTTRPCPLWEPNSKLDNHAVGDRCMWCEGTKFVVEYVDPQVAFDAAQSELSALREELTLAKDTAASWKFSADGLAEESKEFHRLLTAAKQRNAELVEHLEGLKHRCEIFIRGDDGRGMNVDGIRHTLVLVNAALKPTESGARMSSKIEVPRSLLEALFNADSVEQHQGIDRDLRALLAAHVVERQPVAYEKPNCTNYYGHSNTYIDWKYSKDTMALVEHLESIIDAVPDGPLYTAPPELAELQDEIKDLKAGWYTDDCDNLKFWPEEIEDLQATIANLDSNLFRQSQRIAEQAAEIERLKSESFESLYNDAVDEIDRLKGGQGEPIYQVMYRGDGGGGWSDAEKDSYDMKVPHPKHWKTRIVYTSQPAPVAAPDGWKLVPEVATLEMKNAGWQECDRQGVDPESIEMQTIWAAMHLNAPACLDKVKELNQ